MVPIFLRPTDGGFTADLAELPGCSVQGATREEAVARARAAAADYLALLKRHGAAPERARGLDPAQLTVVDSADPWIIAPDLQPLTEPELQDFLHEVEALHAEVLATLKPLDAEALARRPREGMWSVREALEHIAQVQIGYLSKLERWPDGELATFRAVHRMIVQRFAAKDAPAAAVDHTIRGNQWTTRRVMRRLLAHEYEHLGQIREILAALA